MTKAHITPRGAKGGGKQRTPVESPDSLRSIAYFRILDLISEGEIGGLVNGQQSIYLDETPLANADGSLNFQNVHVETRSGTQDQETIPGYPAVENEINVGVELKQSSPWVRSLNNTALSALRITIGVPGLSKADTSNGDINGYSISYRIEVQADGGAYVVAYNGAITGKTTTKYQRSHRIDLPAATTGWNIRVTRTTANANSSSIADVTTIDSYTEVIDAKLRYPNSALMAISGDAAQFSNIPRRAYDMWGRVIQVPSNYDPLHRTYAGVWDGSFKPAWTDNPAWIYYDLATHPRYGLGHLINAAQVNKWELYRISQYCDQSVSDGMGGQEPRFTCNIFLQSASDAYKLLSDLASVFRGISYWAGGTITASADMPADPVYAYTAANVIGGKFTYAASTRKTRYTTALVTWNDPADFYRAKVEYVEDRIGLARYGIQQATLTAFGCTSQAQAQRAGQWVLLTSRLETDTVTFRVGLDGTIAAPGQIIRIADAARAGKRQGGRITSAAPNMVTVDKAPDQVAVGDNLTVVLPSGVSQTKPITAIDGRNLSVAAPGFSELPQAESTWVTESTTLAAQMYRVLSVIEEKSSSDISYTITALQHVADKYAAIDNGTIIQIPPISSLPSATQAPPTNVHLDGHVVITQGIATNVMTIGWDAAKNATSYQVEWRRNDGEWVSAGRSYGSSIDIEGIYTGNYIARVRAINSGEVSSLPALSPVTVVAGKTGMPPAITSLTALSEVFAIGLKWGLPAGAEDTQRTEIWYGQNGNLEQASKLADFAYPQSTHTLQGLAAGVTFFFWGRLVDKTGNVGPWYPAGTGIRGQSSSDASPILDYLAGQIGKTELAQELLAPIESTDKLAETVLDQALRGDGLYQTDRIDGLKIAQTIDVVSTVKDELHSEITRVDGVVARMSSAEASIIEQQHALASESEARASALTKISAHIDSTDATVSDVKASYATRNYAESLVQSAVSVAVGKVNADVQNNARAIADETSARTQADQTLRSSIDSTTATVQNIQSTYATRSYAESMAQSTVNAAIGPVNASVQTNANAIASLSGKVSSAWNVKVGITADGKYYGAGMTVGIDNSSGPVQSQILFQADRFALINLANNQVTTPFVIQNGQTFINQAFIADASITSAKIGDYIESRNFDGTHGWRINRDGSAYFGSEVTVTGTVSADSIDGVLNNIISVNQGFSPITAINDFTWLDLPGISELSVSRKLRTPAAIVTVGLFGTDQLAGQARLLFRWESSPNANDFNDWQVVASYPIGLGYGTGLTLSGSASTATAGRIQLKVQIAGFNGYKPKCNQYSGIFLGVR